MSASLSDTYKALLTALVPICDDCLYFLEGTDQWRWQVLASWGDGFATNPTLVNYSTVRAVIIVVLQTHFRYRRTGRAWSTTRLKTPTGTPA